METVRITADKTKIGHWAGYSVWFHFGHRITTRSIYFISGILAIMVVGAVLRAWNLGSANLWTDEAWTAARVHAPLAKSLATIVSVRNHGPVYFLLLRVFPNTTDALLRFPSALLGLAGIALLVFVVAWFTHDRERALWAGILLAVNPFHVSLSRTARPYAMIFFLALLVSFIFLLMLSERHSRKLWIGLAVTSLLTYGTHYSAAALLIAQYVVFGFILHGKIHIFRQWAMAQAIAAIPALGWVIFTLWHPIKIVTEWIPRPALHDIPLSIWNLLLGYDGVFKWELLPGLALVTLGLALGVRTTLRERANNYKNLYWLALILVALIPVYLMSRYFISIYVDRYFTIFLPGLLILMVEGWMGTPRLVRTLALGIILVTGLYTILLSFHDGSYRREDWQAAAQFITSNTQPGDAILVERDNIEETFRYYFDPQKRTASLDATIPIVRLSETPDTTTLERSAGRLWVIYRNPNEDIHRLGEMPDFNPFDAHRTAMGAWLNARQAEVVESRKFHGMYIFLLDSQQTAKAN